MRHLFILFLLTVTRLQSQDFEIIASGDTLTIRESNVATDPFGFGDNPLKHLQKGNPRKTFQTYPNRHVENKIDTVFTLTSGKDHFEIMKWDENENGLVKAEVTTGNFKTRQGLKVGMKKNEIISKMSKYGLKIIPGYLILENLEVYELITFKFTGDTLSKITFQGYID